MTLYARCGERIPLGMTGRAHVVEVAPKPIIQHSLDSLRSVAARLRSLAIGPRAYRLTWVYSTHGLPCIPPYGPGCNIGFRGRRYIRIGSLPVPGPPFHERVIYFALYADVRLQKDLYASAILLISAAVTAETLMTAVAALYPQI